MAKTREQKRQILNDYQKYIEEAKAIYITSTKLTANESNALKKELNKLDSKYSVIKNTIFAIAAEKIIGEKPVLSGGLSAVFCNGDVVEAAKILSRLKKEEKASYVLCILDKKVSSGEQIEKLSKLESKEQLLSKLLYLVNYPTTGLARVLANNIEKLLYALNAVKDSK